MGNFVYQTHHILERHLKIGAKMSLKEIIDDSLNGKGLDVLRGPALQIYSEETNGGKVIYLSTHNYKPALSLQKRRHLLIMMG